LSEIIVPGEQPKPWFYWRVRHYYDSRERHIEERVYTGEVPDGAPRYIGHADEQIRGRVGPAVSVHLTFGLRGAETIDEAWGLFDAMRDETVEKAVPQVEADVAKKTIAANARGPMPGSFGKDNRKQRRHKGH